MFMVFFQAGACDLVGAIRALQSAGLPVSRSGDELVVIRDGAPEFRIRLNNNAAVVQAEAAEIGSGSPHAERLGRCAARFEVAFDDLDSALAETHTLMDLQGALQTATDGYLFTAWNGVLTAPWSESVPDETTVQTLSPSADEGMRRAILSAQSTIGIFYRELHWEQHRIIPANDFAGLKVAVSDDPRLTSATDASGLRVEYIWVDAVAFNGVEFAGTVLNMPNEVQSVSMGQRIIFPLDRVADWTIHTGGQILGGYTNQHIRSTLDPAARAAFDASSGVDLGDPSVIQLVRIEPSKTSPRTVPDRVAHSAQQILSSEHPMAVSMSERLAEDLEEMPGLLHDVSDDGFSTLHRAALAGATGIVQQLLDAGADPSLKTAQGLTAFDLASCLDWRRTADAIAAATGESIAGHASALPPLPQPASAPQDARPAQPVAPRPVAQQPAQQRPSASATARQAEATKADTSSSVLLYIVIGLIALGVFAFMALGQSGPQNTNVRPTAPTTTLEPIAEVELAAIEVDALDFDDYVKEALGIVFTEDHGETQDLILKACNGEEWEASAETQRLPAKSVELIADTTPELCERFVDLPERILTEQAAPSLASRRSTAIRARFFRTISWTNFDTFSREASTYCSSPEGSDLHTSARYSWSERVQILALAANDEC